MFEQLFKFSSLQFAEGDIGFQAGPWLVVAGAIVLFLVVGFGIVYAITNIYTNDRVKAVSLGLRIPALLLLCLPLFEPVLITPDVVPDENFVAVVVDASASMTIPDGTLAETRFGDAATVLFDEGGGVVPGLDDYFKLRYYTFSHEALRSDSVQSAAADGPATNISAALDRVLNDFRGLPLSGVVLLSDGGDNSAEVPLNKAEELRSLGVPLYVVGLGQEAFEQEREILDVTVSKAVEQTTGAEIDVKVRSWRDEEAPVEVRIYQGDEQVFTEDRRLKGGGKIDQFTLFFEPPAPDAREYRIELAGAEGELNTANNSLPMLVDTRNDTLRVLYFEQVRPDLKYIKRALEDDQVVDIASITRTGTGKFYRQGIRSPDELAGGFPADEAALFDFEAVILGDIEAANFTLEQLRMLERFVRVRGGGFLMLGGRNTFAEGDYWNTPIADLLPVDIDPSRRTVLPPQFEARDQEPAEQGFRFVPTAAGLESPILKLSPDVAVNRQRWSEMPGLTSINYLGAVKPGAVVLAEKPADDFGASEPLLAAQYYGRGRSVALPTASTWRWQMLLEADDARHQRFWRQLARWLAASASGPVAVDLGPRRFAPNDDVPMTLTAVNERYEPLEQAAVEAQVTDPSGTTQPVDFREELTRAGSYTATFSPQDEGLYTLTVAVRDDAGTFIGTQTQPFLVRPDNREFYDATLKRTFLESLAEAAAGRYYAPEDADELPDVIRTRRTSTSIYHAEYLWDMPLIFGLVLLLLSAEWFYRRKKGLP